MRGGGNAVQLNNLPATLTAEGAKSFAGYYEAGTALDPVSLSADVKAEAAAKPSATPSPTKSKPKSEETQGTSGAIKDGAVDWGVRRTFREYVTGNIAQGEWKLSDGAQDGGALFRFPEGAGTYDEKKQTLDASFTGAVRFTGEHGLDLRLSAIKTAVADGRGTLYADVTGPELDEKKVPLVTFEAKDFKPKDGLAAVTEAPAKLTAEGAKAFAGMYKAGTEMDPVSLAVALTDNAQLPALPDLGSTESATPTATPKADAAKESEPKTEATASSSDVPVLPIGLAVGSLLAVGAAFMIVRGRSGRPASDGPGTSDAGDNS
jgi:hypothetical protein